MSGFFASRVNIIEQIIRTAERKAKPEESCKSVYQRGWIMFKEFLLQKTVVNLTYPSESTKTTVFS